MSWESIRVKAEILWEEKPEKEEKGKRSQRETTVKKSMGEWCNWERGSIVEPSKTKDGLWLQGKSEVSPSECRPRSNSSCLMILGNLCVLCWSLKGSTDNLPLTNSRGFQTEIEVMTIYHIGMVWLPHLLLRLTHSETWTLLFTVLPNFNR